MRVLVTGGAGFIGSNLVDALAAAGHEPGVIDDLSTGRRANLAQLGSGLWFRQLDILDPGLGRALAEFAPDAVVHLAAQASVQASLRDPARDWAVNAEGTRAVALAAARAGARRVLSASSAAVYGDPESVPLVEGARMEPLSPYGRSKLAAESALAEALANTGVDFASLRFANVYGPRQDARGEGGVISIFLDTVATGGQPVVFGGGRQTRDFIYVGDVTAAICEALESDARLAPSPDSAAYNISTGIETTLDELADAVRRATGFAGAFDRLPAREGDIERSALDPGKARRVFGWSAQTALGNGLALTWDWFKRREG